VANGLVCDAMRCRLPFVNVLSLKYRHFSVYSCLTLATAAMNYSPGDKLTII